MPNWEYCLLVLYCFGLVSMSLDGQIRALVSPPSVYHTFSQTVSSLCSSPTVTSPPAPPTLDYPLAPPTVAPPPPAPPNPSPSFLHQVEERILVHLK